MKPRPLSEWNEDIGPVLWWRFPVEEFPYVGTPLDLGRPVLVQVRVDSNEKEHQLPNITVMVGGWIDGYYTHWTEIPMPEAPE